VGWKPRGRPPEPQGCGRTDHSVDPAIAIAPCTHHSFRRRSSMPASMSTPKPSPSPSPSPILPAKSVRPGAGGQTRYSGNSDRILAIKPKLDRHGLPWVSAQGATHRFRFLLRGAAERIGPLELRRGHRAISPQRHRGTEIQRRRARERERPFFSRCLRASVVRVFPDGNNSQDIIGKPTRENVSCARRSVPQPVPG